MEIDKLLPLSEASFYVLLALVQPRHGYGVMQAVEAMSGGAVRIGPGTLYGAFQTMEKQGLIRLVREEERRKLYQTTPDGDAVLAAQRKRLELMIRAATQEEIA